MESPKQGKGIKKTMLIDAKGSERVFMMMRQRIQSKIKLAKVNGNWEKVIHAAS